MLQVRRIQQFIIRLLLKLTAEGVRQLTVCAGYGAAILQLLPTHGANPDVLLHPSSAQASMYPYTCYENKQQPNRMYVNSLNIQNQIENMPKMPGG